MKRELGFFFVDETMNLFKLKLYNWNVNDAILNYKDDKFCLDYCIDQNYQYGCGKKQLRCPYKHSINCNLRDLVVGNLQQQDFKQGKLLCLYLMYQKKYNDNNAALFNMYATILSETAKSKQDYLKSERYYLKALAIDKDYHIAHNNYAGLLNYRLHNYDKAEYHYNQSLTINDKVAMSHASFASFLIYKRKKYELALSHSEKACKLEPNLSYAHYVKAISLDWLNKFDLSLKEYHRCLELNKKDGMLWAKQVKDAEEQIDILKNKTNQENNDNDSDNKLLLNTISSDLTEPTTRDTKISQDKTNNRCNEKNTNMNNRYVTNDYII